MNWSKACLGLLAGCWITGCSPTATEDGTPTEATSNTDLFGHRLRITADLVGDGRVDTLTEVYYSRSLGREVAKYVQDMGYDSLVARTYDLQALVMLRRSDGAVDTLDDRGRGFGLALLVNEGDLDGDGGDEVGYVLDNADWSNTNTYRVATWKQGSMRVLFTFPIWDWQLPDLPDSEREYGLIGQTGRRLRAPMNSMPAVDLVLPIRSGAVKVVGNIGEATWDTMEVHFGGNGPVRYVGALEPLASPDSQ
jgi:hypothetical protein